MLPMAGHFKQLCNKSQQRVPAAVAICLTWSKLWYSVFPSSGCFRILYYETKPCVPQAVQSILTHSLPYSAHLCCFAELWGHGKARGRLVTFSIGLSWPSD